MKEKGLDNCAYCEDFACDNLKTRMNFFEDRLGDLTKIPEEDYTLFIEPYMSKKRLLEIRTSVEQGTE